MLAALGEEMREIDRKTIEEIGILGLVLMEEAGRQVALEAKAMLTSPQNKILVLAGAGNNGGDGYVAARLLHNWGFSVQVWLLTSPDKIKGDAKINLKIMQKLLPMEKIRQITSSEILQVKESELKEADLIIDAILGTGTQGEVTGIKREIILALNSLNKKVLAVDLPSGLNANTGQVLGCCVQATRTVTFALPKVGLLVHPAVEYAGTVKTVDIGIPPQVIEQLALQHVQLEPALVKQWLPQRKATAHKGSCGRVLVLAGSEGMLGAAVLCAEAVLKIGAGLVTLALPKSIYPLAATKLTEVMTRPLPETAEGTLALMAWAQVEKLVDKADVLVLGPGLSSQGETAILVLKILEETNLPVVVDADGLNILADNPHFLNKKRKNLVFTPHPGEMVRLTEKTMEEVQNNRLDLVREKAQEWGVSLVLKGAGTLVASPQGKVYVNSTGNPGMATAGAGDVLAGVIGGLLAQGLTTTIAAASAVYIHGLAGDLARNEQGEMGLLAGDILAYLPKALKLVKEEGKC